MKKRFRKGISLILAVVLVLAIIPAAGATETESAAAPTYEYVFTRAATGITSSTESDYNIDTLNSKWIASVDSVSTGSWTPIGRRGGSSYRVFDGGYRFSVKDTATADAHLLGGNGTLFKVTVNESGTYHPAITYFSYRNGSKVNIYLSEAEMGTNNASVYINKVSTGQITEGVLFADSINTYEDEVKKEWVAEKRKTELFDGRADITLEKGKEYYLVVAIDGEASSNYSTSQGEVTSTYSHEFYYQLYSFGLTKVETEEPAEPETLSGNVSFVATSNVGSGERMTVEAESFTYDELVDKIPIGTAVKVTAPEKEGYEFKHWVRGSRDNGVYVSDDPEYSFTALTHTFLTAIYEETVITDNTTAVVEFYNGNGQYLEKATSTIGGTVSLPATAPSLTGFVFANAWETEDGIFTDETTLTKALTRAVAKYNENPETFEVTDHKKKIHNLTYGTEIELTSDSNVYWLRDNTVVDYGKSYTYAAWDNTVITTSATGEINPLVVLDTEAKGGARMIEYDNGGKNLIEVGIIFGDSADIEIGSCSSKATSQENAAHGQFTAKPNSNESHARGYLIYEEDGFYKVVYSK